MNQDKLKTLLVYNKNTGVFMWPVKTRSRKSGKVAGQIIASGYRLIGLENNIYRAHLLAWMYEYGEFPITLVDHIDGNKDNNQISNLRLASKSQNAFNMKLKVNNTSGIKGVSWRANRNKWRVYLKVNGVAKSFGHYDDLELAELVANEARSKYHGEFARYN